MMRLRINGHAVPAHIGDRADVFVAVEVKDKCIRPARHIDTPRVGHCAWNELTTSDQPAAWHFYGQRFGWVKDGAMPMGEMGDYEFIRHGEHMLGAIMKGTAEMGPPITGSILNVKSPSSPWKPETS